MIAKLQWILVLSLCSLVLAVLMQGPQWRHQQHPLARGLAVSLNSDEAIYLARIQESLSGRPEQSAEAFTGHPNLVGTQFAMIERFYGTVFRFTGWRAPAVATFLDVVVPIAVFLSLVFFFQLVGFDKKTALITTCLFCVLQLYSLNRPIHMRSSFLVMLWSLNFLLLSLRSRWWWSVLAGTVLGLLVGVYVWSFMFAWAFWGVFLLWELMEWAMTHVQKKKSLLSKLKQVCWFLRPRKPTFTFLRWHLLLIAGVAGLLTALPFIAQYIILQTHPLYAYGEFRSGMHHGRLPESLPYSLIFFVALVLGVCAHRADYEKLRPYRPAFVLLGAACIYMNQQLVHGVVFNFVSHGIFSLMLAALAVISVAVVTRQQYLLLAALVLSVYAAAITYDGRYVLGQWTVSESRFENQFLVETLPVFDGLERGRVLSDPATMAFIASNTHHDIVYSIYLKNVLMTHREIALRYCLSQLPLRPEQRRIRETQHLIMPDAVSAFKGDTRTQEIAMVESACAELDSDPEVSLNTFEVSYVLWNKVAEPDWNVRRLRTNLEEIASGPKWTLYRIVR